MWVINNFMNTLWYTGCSMTKGDEIADPIYDKDFFSCWLWDDEDHTISIKNHNQIFDTKWKKSERKTKRLSRLNEVACKDVMDPLKYSKTLSDMKDHLDELEHENNWCSQLARKLNLEPVHAAASAASPGYMFTELIKDLKNEREVRIMSWTYPYRLTFWGKRPYLRYPAYSWMPAHMNNVGHQNPIIGYILENCFDSDATTNEYVESIFFSAKILENIGKPWYFNFGFYNHMSEVTAHYPKFAEFCKQYEDHILYRDIFAESYKVTDHLIPRAMYAGHPRLEAHNFLAENIYEKIKNEIFRN